MQWGDPDGKRALGKARTRLPSEFTTAIDPSLPFTRLPDRDGYAAEVGFSGGFPAARDPRTGQAWLAHCYAMVGAGRGDDVESGSGAELYVVTGHAPRQLDRNIARVGRVVAGMELLSALPRGGGPLGFYEDPAQHVPIRSVRIAAVIGPQLCFSSSPPMMRARGRRKGRNARMATTASSPNSKIRSPTAVLSPSRIPTCFASS